RSLRFGEVAALQVDIACRELRSPGGQGCVEGARLRQLSSLGRYLLLDGGQLRVENRYPRPERFRRLAFDPRQGGIRPDKIAVEQRVFNGGGELPPLIERDRRGSGPEHSAAKEAEQQNDMPKTVSRPRLIGRQRAATLAASPDALLARLRRDA